MLFAARAFAGACAGNIAAAQAYIADVTGPEERAKGMGLIGAAFGLGFIIGPALGGLLAGNDPATADLADAGLDRRRALAARAARRRVPAAREPAGRAARSAPAARSRARAVLEALRRPVLSRLILIFFLVILAFAGMESTFALWAMAAIRLGTPPGRLCLRLCRRCSRRSCRAG